MNAQDKAKELVEKYDQTFTYLESKNKAKQCAIIAVDEILNLDYFSEEGREYWQEIKNEIEKLWKQTYHLQKNTAIRLL